MKTKKIIIITDFVYVILVNQQLLNLHLKNAKEKSNKEFIYSI